MIQWYRVFLNGPGNTDINICAHDFRENGPQLCTMCIIYSHCTMYTTHRTQMCTTLVSILISVGRLIFTWQCEIFFEAHVFILFGALCAYVYKSIHWVHCMQVIHTIDSCVSFPLWIYFARLASESVEFRYFFFIIIVIWRLLFTVYYLLFNTISPYSTNK